MLWRGHRLVLGTAAALTSLAILLVYVPILWAASVVLSFALAFLLLRGFVPPKSAPLLIFSFEGDALTNHGWTYMIRGRTASFSRVRTPDGENATGVKGTFETAMDRSIEHVPVRGLPITLELLAAGGERATFYAQFQGHKGSGAASEDLWLCFSLTSPQPAQPTGGGKEWIYPLAASKRARGWYQYRVDLTKAVEETLASEWQVEALSGFRIRGTLALRHVEIRKQR